ncbi:hypothetical protein AB0D46_06230 [Streptomyces sp. NPDC048383]|uniref:hypothetical protein n=1 Tax=Streptomyces sp. NPDC048383 TaxID=3155386 RepID=UPI00341ED427
MFRHRRVRTVAVFLISWVVLCGVELWGEDAPWRAALVSGLLWAAVVTGAWWFAEWTQASRLRRPHPGGGTGDQDSRASV